MLFLALTRCKDQVTGRIGCSQRGAGEFARGNPWDLPCKLRPAPAAKDEAGFPQPSRSAVTTCLVGLDLLRRWDGSVPVSAVALPGVGGSNPASLAVNLVPPPTCARGCNKAPLPLLRAAFPILRNDRHNVQNYLCQRLESKGGKNKKKNFVFNPWQSGFIIAPCQLWSPSTSRLFY